MSNALDDLIADGIAEGKSKGKTEGMAEFIIDLLEEYGGVTDDLKEMVFGQTDIFVLKSWHKLAAHAGSVDEFVKGIK